MKSNINFIALAALLIAVGMAGDAVSQPDLHDAGFTNLVKYDYSRTIRPAKDYFGRDLNRETARPVQVCVWYPAVSAKDSSPIVFGDYLFPYPQDEEFFDYLSYVQDREIGYLQAVMGQNRGGILDMLSVKMGAVKDAPAVTGSFPIILYFPDFGRGVGQDFIMCEHLAQRGFIVATVPSIGSLSLNPDINRDDIENIVRDIEFALAEMRQFPNTDIKRIGVIGRNRGGLGVLRLIGRNFDVDAAAVIDGAYLYPERYYLSESDIFINSTRIYVPLFNIKTRGAFDSEESWTSQMRYAPRYNLALQAVEPYPGDSYDYLITKEFPSIDSTVQADRTVYERIGQNIFRFFSAELNGDSDAAKYLEGKGDSRSNITFAAAMTPPPTAEQFISILRDDGIDKAVEIYNKFKDPNTILFTEPVFNAIGYQYFQSGNVADAIRIFEMNASAYPGSANTWDSLGEACEAAGRSDDAIRHLRKALEILPNDTTTDPQLKEAIRAHAEEALTRLGG